jgi:hypothetical protein
MKNQHHTRVGKRRLGTTDNKEQGKRKGEARND